MIRFDAEMFRSINNLAGRYPALDAIGVFCARYLIVVMFLAVIARALIVARRPESRTLAFALTAAEFKALAAAALAFLGNWLFSRLAFRPRPYMALKDVHRIIPEPLTSYAFPSGHSSVAFALAFTLLFVDPPFGAVMLVAAAAVAIGRVFTGVHYPLDVVVGAVVGLFWALIVHGIGMKINDLEIVKRALKLGRR